jgi:hypothetical protein
MICSHSPVGLGDPSLSVDAQVEPPRFRLRQLGVGGSIVRWRNSHEPDWTSATDYGAMDGTAEARSWPSDYEFQLEDADNHRLRRINVLMTAALEELNNELEPSLQ